jgi:hypothetical protein
VSSVPWGLLSAAIGQIPRAGRWAERRLSLSDDPLLVIALPNPIDQADEQFLEWPHLEVRNTGLKRARRRPRTAREAHLRVAIEGRQDTRPLMWSGGAFGQAEPVRDVRSEWPARVPLVIRSSFDQPLNILGTPIDPNVCYLTDAEFLTQGRPRVTFDVGVHNLEVIVQYGHEAIETVSAWFRLTVPPATSPRLKLTLDPFHGPP